MKVLQDIESLQQGKIDKTQIKNNLTETTVGNVLDATQGKVLSEQISTLKNGSLISRGYYNGDMDALLTPGTYLCGSSGGTNKPQATTWGTVNVYLGGTGSIIQEWVSADNVNKFYRHHNGAGWGQWQEMTTTQILNTRGYFTSRPLDNGIDLDSVTSNGIYEYNAYGEYVNAPSITEYGHLIGVMTVMSGVGCTIQTIYPTYNGETILFRKKHYASGWSQWKQMVTEAVIPTFTGGRGNIEGGEIRLARPENDTTLQADVSLDIYGDSFRIFENGGKYRGVSLNLGACYNGSDSKIFTNTKTSFSCTANTGYTIVWQDCYVLNGFAHIHVRIKATDNTVWGNWQHGCFTTPYSTGTKRVSLTLTPYVQPELITMGTTTQNGVIWQGYQAYITPSTATSYGYEVKCVYEI